MHIEWGRLVRGRPVLGVAVSLVLHLSLVVLVMWAGAPVARYAVKRGEPLFVELPELPEPAPAGNLAAKSAGPPAPSPAPPTRPARPAGARPPRQSPRPAPPAVASRAQPAPEPVRPAPKAEPAPQPPPPVPELPKPQEAATLPAPAPTPAPAEPAPVPRPPAVAGPPAPPAPTGPAGPQVAAVPRGGLPTPPAVDIRSALGRGGGAGGQGGGRGGVEGEPIPLDSRDPKFSDYLDRVRRMIKERWGFPCVKNPVTRECEYKSAQLVVEFGIAKDGRVPFVNVMRSSGWPIYDDYAVNAIKLAAPFPPVPDSISKKGIPILATFNYVVDTSLTNLLR